MSLKGRFRLLNVTVGVLCLLVTFTVGFAWLEVRRAAERNSQFEQIVEAFVELEKVTEAYLYLGDQRLKDQWIEKHQSFERLIERQRSFFGEDAIVGELRHYLGELKAVFGQVSPGTIEQREHAQGGSSASDNQIARDALSNRIHRITAVTVASLARHNVEILGKKEKRAFVLILVFVAVLSVGTLANFVPLARRLLGSMDALRRGAASIGSGSLDYRIVIGSEKDEFDEIGVAFNSMVARLELSYSRLVETKALLERAYEDLEKRVEERTAALTESKERYRAVFENSLNAIIVTDSSPPGSVVSANPAACRLFDLTSEEILGMDRGILFATDDEAILPVTQWEESYGARTELTFTRNDGSLFVGECSITSFSDSVGNRRVVHIIRDVTDRKQVEDALRRSHDELEQRVRERTVELAQLAELLNQTRDAILVRDMEGRITFWNRGAEEMYGWSWGEALGQAEPIILKTHPSQSLEVTISELLARGRWDGQLVQTKRDGSEITVASRWVVLQGEEGKPVGVLQVNTDITNQQVLETSASPRPQDAGH